ncbi:hypothetical protein [Novosphingobium panipatense]|uniref:hypothetical protein n=1 Tax=Novosphingobium panipatense TaxID=428991 RepID=UPI00360F3246
MKRPLVFLFPNNRMDIGGNSAQMRFMEACGHSRAVTAVQYSVDRRGKINSQDFVRSNGSEPIYVIHWGPDVPQLLAALNGKDVIYFAHSTGWRMRLPSYVPILCVSRHTMAYWGRYAPNSYIAHVPNIVEVKKFPQHRRGISMFWFRFVSRPVIFLSNWFRLFRTVAVSP